MSDTINLSLMNNNIPICCSGGADGSDLQWGMNAGKAGHMVIHWSFDSHKSMAPEEETVKLSNEHLEVATPFLERANLSLKRRVPTHGYVKSLLQRNYYQIAWSNSLYAVSSFDKKGQVKGGTAWATQMFMDRILIDKIPNLSMFLYDQEIDKWFTFILQWKELTDINTLPVPTGIWAGIGTRELNDNGKKAIRSLFNK